MTHDLIRNDVFGRSTKIEIGKAGDMIRLLAEYRQHKDYLLPESKLRVNSKGQLQGLKNRKFTNTLTVAQYPVLAVNRKSYLTILY